jgi:hypothetical protein
LTSTLPAQTLSPTKLAREVIEEHPDKTGWDFARECVARIDPEDYKFYLETMFKAQFSQFVGGLRNPEIQRAKSEHPSQGGKAEPQAQTFIGLDDAAAPLVGPARWKLDNFWSQRISVGTEYKTLGELTIKDLDVVIALRETQAAANQRRADEFRAVKDYMIEHKLEHAAEVGDKVRRLLKHLS